MVDEVDILRKAFFHQEKALILLRLSEDVIERSVDEYHPINCTECGEK